jgi:hypothetical protein
MSSLPPPVLLRHKDGFMEQVMMCTLCQELPLDPVVTPCSHIFCRDCIHEALRHRSECPNDRQRLNSAMLEPIDGIARRVWEQIGVMCPTPNCSWTGTIGNYKNHANRCRNFESCDGATIAEYEAKISEIKKSHLLEIKELESSYEAEMEELQAKHQREMKDALAKQLKKFEQIAHIYNNQRIPKIPSKVDLKGRQESVEEHDPNYDYDRTKVVELTQLICRNLENPPESIDRKRIYSCVKKCIDDVKAGWADNPENLKIHVRMLLNVCRASTWFTERQQTQIEQWCIDRGW